MFFVGLNQTFRGGLSDEHDQEREEMTHGDETVYCEIWFLHSSSWN